MDAVSAARPLELATWPGGAQVAVCLTFDVDAECGWLGESPGYARRLSTLSEGRFGAIRGVPRILDVLAEADVKGTFYIPGDTVERHPDAVTAIVEGAHELGHHGHIHLRSDGIDEDRQREEIERGLAALAPYTAPPALGYRSPSWELTPETFSMLVEYGFAYDSSAMGDDRPYVEAYDGREILELPIHWSLDDWPYFGWTVEGGGILAEPDHVLAIWKREFDLALEERRLVTFTMHPEIIGRGYRIGLLRGIIAYAKASGTVWFATHGEVAGLYAQKAAVA